MMQVSTVLGRTTGSCSLAKKGVKDITKSTKVKSLKSRSKDITTTPMPITVVGGALVWIAECLISLVYLFEFFLGTILTIAVGMVFEG